jgi:hypothetical protein
VAHGSSPNVRATLIHADPASDHRSNTTSRTDIDGDDITSATDWAILALGVLPALPIRLPAVQKHFRASEVSLIAPSGRRQPRTGAQVYLQAELGSIDVGRGAELVMQVNRGAGGYLIRCRVDKRCFVGGLDGRFDLEVLSVARVKPTVQTQTGIGVKRDRDALLRSA